MSRMRLFLSLVILAGVGAVILACASTSSAANTGAAVTGTVAAPTPLPHFKVGQQVKVGDTWLITVNSVKTNAGDDVFSPASGNVYVVVDITLKNLSNQSQDVSSLASFTFKDATGQSYNEALADIGTPPDGTVQVGDQLRGQLVYETPKTQTQFTLTFQADVFSDGATIWDLSV